MSPLPPLPRLRLEAGRAFFGAWLIFMSLFAAPQLYSWLGRHRPTHPELRLVSAVSLTVLACVGLTLVTTAGLRALTTLVAAPRSAAGQTTAT